MEKSLLLTKIRKNTFLLPKNLITIPACMNYFRSYKKIFYHKYQWILRKYHNFTNIIKFTIIKKFFRYQNMGKFGCFFLNDSLSTHPIGSIHGGCSQLFEVVHRNLGLGILVCSLGPVLGRLGCQLRRRFFPLFLGRRSLLWLLLLLLLELLL